MAKHCKNRLKHLSLFFRLYLVLTIEALPHPGSSCSACGRRWSSVAWSRWRGRPPGPRARRVRATPWRTLERGRVCRDGSGGTGLSGGACPSPGTQPCLEEGENVSRQACLLPFCCLASRLLFPRTADYWDATCADWVSERASEWASCHFACLMQRTRHSPSRQNCFSPRIEGVSFN